MTLHASAYVGRQEIRRDVAEPDRIERLAALLDGALHWRPGLLPPLGHWLYFLPAEPMSALGPDGHPLRTDDGFLPNVDLPRRMWAGSRISFLRDIPIGSALIRRSIILSAVPKVARSGRLLLVTVRHEISVGAESCIVEEQDIVYREAASAGAAFTRASIDPGEERFTSKIIRTDPVLLFRFSALTFNAHRIHYDRDYARDVEGYPDLVVHGPLIATLMLDNLLRTATLPLASFNFRALSPLFEGEPIALGFFLEQGGAQLRALSPAGVAMSGVVGFAG
jgi:3-methylfumaryl-CoA hydratase